MRKAASPRRPIEEKTLVSQLNQLYEWAKDSRKLVPEIVLIRSSTIAEINRPLTDGYDRVNALVLLYEDGLIKNNRLEKQHQRKKVYEAGIKCCNDFNERFDKLKARARKIGIYLPSDIPD